MNSPLVSVIIPTHNRADYFLPRAARSVLNQTWQNLELIIVDDASTDATAHTVSALQDQRVRYLVQNENRGRSVARNSGIAAARGDFIALLDDDDEWLPQKLERQLLVFDAKPDLGLVYGGWKWLRDDTGVTQRCRVPDERGLIDGRPRWCYNMVDDFLVRIELIQKTLFLEDRAMLLENTDILIRLAQICCFGYVPEPLTLCYNHGLPRSSDLVGESARSLVASIDRLLRSHYAFLSLHPLAWTDFNLSAGIWRLRDLDDRSGARKCFSAGIRAAPHRPKVWACMLASFLPMMAIPLSLRVVNSRIWEPRPAGPKMVPGRAKLQR